ncbi:MAG: iron-containing alcohol dehydrogenase, partial [Desulfarculus sp.]|nr:iron-containing alcohol dehydrogenase [Desulfarculus sp.]
VRRPKLPLVAVNTTAGTGSEVTRFTIITDPGTSVKMLIADPHLVAEVAIDDPLLTVTCPPLVTASTGLDALTHAIEAYTSTAYGPLTDLYALEAIRLVVRNLTAAIHAPQDLEPRSNMLLGSMYAGLAFSNAILGAVHAMAHSLGGFLDLPHGECNAILLEHVVAYNFCAIPERYRAVAASLGRQTDALDHETLLRVLLATLRDLRKAAGVTRTLSQLGVQAGDFRRLATNAYEDACLVTNPRVATISDIERIYEAAL